MLRQTDGRSRLKARSELDDNDVGDENDVPDVEDWVEIGEGAFGARLQGLDDVAVAEPVVEAGRARRVVNDRLDVVGDEDAPQVEDVQHAGRVVVRDAVALDHVLGGHHLPVVADQTPTSLSMNDTRIDRIG